MNVDILSFFGEQMDALPIYEQLEQRIHDRIPDVNIEVVNPRSLLPTSVDSLLCPSTPVERQRSDPRSG